MANTEIRLEQMGDRIGRGRAGHFYCIKCKCNLSSQCYSIPNDYRQHLITCPRCFNQNWIDPGQLALQVLLNMDTPLHD